MSHLQRFKLCFMVCFQIRQLCFVCCLCRFQCFCVCRLLLRDNCSALFLLGSHSLLLFLFNGIFQSVGFFFYRFLLFLQHINLGLSGFLPAFLFQLYDIVRVLLLRFLPFFCRFSGRYGRAKVCQFFLALTLLPGFFLCFCLTVQFIDLGVNRLDLAVLFFINQLQPFVVFLVDEFQTLVGGFLQLRYLRFLGLLQLIQFIFQCLLQSVILGVVSGLDSIVLFIQLLLQFVILIIV